MRENKQVFYEKYFDTNWNNIKKTWKGIKSLIPLRAVPSSVPTVIYFNNTDAITSHYDIANIFNNCFRSIAESTKKTYVNISHKQFSDYLANEIGSTIFLQLTDKQEIANIISSLNFKASGQNNIHYRILFLLIIS